MKQIFTLLTIAFVSVFSTKANSQNVSQGFETSTEVTTLASSCWTFNNFNFTSSSPITGTGSMVSTLGTLSEVITPELQIPAGLNISFSYNMVASTGGSKTLKIFLDINGVETHLETINLQSNPSGTFTSPTYTDANTPGNNINGSRKIIFRVTANASVKFDDLSVNAPYTYAGGCASANIPLPIKLISFQGSLNNNQSSLQWTVDENETGKSFEVEKSTDGKNYSAVGVVLATQNSGTATYTYKEQMQGAAFYRLKIVNKDGSVTYSKILLLKNSTEAASTISLMQNPVRENLTFSFTSLTDKASDLTIYNMAGVKVYSEKLNTQKGRNSVSIKLNSYLSAGTYILEVANNNQRSITKFIK